MKYMSVGFYDTDEMAERFLHQLNQFVYSNKTRYVSTFRVGKEFECRSHMVAITESSLSHTMPGKW
ncbi:hypothetical protein PC116_g10905 [Phytophthora cactorum]|uniref:Uncharacterized protein n=1 Tax=Phytophthora cactorum TaxID=29920 RepID=A0A8T1L0N3_9STRA|nr:hypothetical protein PC114_g8009 [Phytophthora cactorum]KAG2945982.1 hypothetical protein PC117_g7996 [Phytophthora cactorum]KAG4241132.1 hypothetical protein PC116_g10905 [Phytophthora cactorum]